MGYSGFAKDCDCVIHDGPHWLHMHTLDRERLDRDSDALRRVVAAAVTTGTGEGRRDWITAEANRIFRENERLWGELAANMDRHGIERITPEMYAAARSAPPAKRRENESTETEPGA